MADEQTNAGPLSTTSILIVDDDADVRQSLESRLRSAGYRLQCAKNGKEAVGAFIQFYYDDPFDVILLDIDLPDMNGCEILKLIRQEEELRGIRYGRGVTVIMQTGLKASWMDAFNKGCDDYIIKPYSFQDLLGKIEQKIKERKLNVSSPGPESS